VATRWCLECGSEYVETVEVCPDCDLPLSTRDPAGRDPALDADPEGHVAYELHTWAGESRVMLDALLTGEGIPHAWEGTDLVVPAFLEARVDELVDQVDATTLPTLDPEADKVVYELLDWEDALIERLAAALEELEVPFEFDVEGNLVVLADDEARVEDLLESIEFPDALTPDLDADAEGGEEVSELLSELFLAADRLANHARNPEGVLGLVEAAGALEGTAVPFGFAPATWKDLVGQAVRLKEALETDSQTDDELEAHAAELRDALRRYV